MRSTPVLATVFVSVLIQLVLGGYDSENLISPPAVTRGQLSVLEPASFRDVLGEDLSWAADNIPLFESSDATMTSVYYFRWRIFKRHIKATRDTEHPWVVTEFEPDVSWAGAENTISCASGHHIFEGRWLRDPAVMDSYTAWWVSGRPDIKQNYFTWWAHAALARLNVAGTSNLSLIQAVLANATSLTDKFMDGSLPEESAYDERRGCVWNHPGNEGQENSISGDGCRPLVQALLYGEAQALAVLCGLVNNTQCEQHFTEKRDLFQKALLRQWNTELQTFDTLTGGHPSLATGGSAAGPDNTFAGVRELASLTSPWFFGAVPPSSATKYAQAWEAAFDPDGFAGPHGLRTAERRHPRYSCHPAACCWWDGPVWPFETAKALTAATNILQDSTVAPQVPAVTRERLYGMLGQYTAMHTSAWEITAGKGDSGRADYGALNKTGLFLSGMDGSAQSDPLWFAEAGCAEDATWTDAPLKGYWYLHSTYIDVVLSAVCGLVPRGAAAAPALDIMPLQPADDTLAWWAVDGVVVSGRTVAVLWDLDGTRYGRGKGLRVYVDGALAAQAPTTQGPKTTVLL